MKWKGMKFMTFSIVAAWITIGAALFVLNGCMPVPPPAEIKPASLNCDSCLKMPSDAILVDGVLHYYLYGTMQVHTARSVSRAILLTESLTDIRHMRIHMFSGGGNAYTGPGISDVITSAQKRGWGVEVHATGIVASAAIPVFAVCYPRYAAFGTMFMVHPLQGGRVPTEMKEKFTAKYVKYLVLMTKVGRVEWRKMVDDTTWFTVEKAMEWGLVDAIQ